MLEATARQIRSSEVGPTKVGIVQAGTNQRRAGEIGPSQLEAGDAGVPRAAGPLVLIQKLYKVEAKATRTNLKHTEGVTQ